MDILPGFQIQDWVSATHSFKRLASKLAHILSAYPYSGSLECSSIFLSDAFAPVAHLYTGQLPRLAFLSISYSMSSHDISVLSSGLALLPNLHRLTQLKTLNLDISTREMRVDSDTSQCRLPDVPESLKKLHSSFHCWTNKEIQFCLSQNSVMLEHASHLTCLELLNCTLCIP